MLWPVSQRACLALRLALTLSAANALGASEATHACASVVPDSKRLACYDQAFGVSRPRTDGASMEEEFGAKTPSAERKNISSITAAVTAVERRRGLLVVTLSNDQTWAQTEMDSRADVRVGDTVTIRRGALGSYLLDTSAGIAARVRRLR